MRMACLELDIPFSTFRRIAKRLNVYITNQAGKGISKNNDNNPKKIPLEKILNGEIKYKHHTSFKKRLIKDGIKQNKCDKCGIESWNNKSITIHLDHIDGDNENNKLENLRMLCPNCHSQTKTYCRSKKKQIGIKKVTDKEIINKIKESENIYHVLLKVGLIGKGSNYKRVRDIINKYNLTFMGM